MGCGNEVDDLAIAAQHLLEFTLDLLPAMLLEGHRGRTGGVRDAETVERHAVGAGGDAGRQDVEVVGGEYACDLRKQARLIGRRDQKFAEFALGEMAMAADQGESAIL